MGEMQKNGLNVVVICCDTLRADVVDHTWEDQVHMPNVDRLRAESTSFSRAYAEALPTVPMRRGFYTGRRAYPWRHDIPDIGSVPNLLGWHAIPNEYKTLAETLCEKGVMTGLVADLYHLFKPTMNFTRGFISYDYIRGQETDRVRSGPLSKLDLNPHMHPKETDAKRHSGYQQYLLNVMDRKSEEDYFAPRVFRSASNWIDDNAGQKPFFLWVESFTPHEFWDPPKSFADAYFKKDGVVDYLYPQFFQNKFQFTEDEIRRTKALYYGYCTFLDKWVGHLLQKFDEHKLWDNTVLIFTSDHGTELRDKTQFGKSHKLHPYNSRLNLIVRHPDKSTHGKVCNAFVQNTDIAPTVCKLMNVESAESYDGFDLLPLIQGKTQSVRDHVIGAWTEWAYVRTDDHYMLINTLDPDKKLELYDVKADPRENENIASAKPKVVAELRAKLEKLLGVPLPAKYAHQVRNNRAPGIHNFVEHWKDSNLQS